MNTRPVLDCPQCHCRLLRVPRTWTDHCVDAVVPVRRYRCSAAVCGWQGLLRRRDWPAAPAGYPPVDLPSQVLDAASGFASPQRSSHDT